MLAQIRRARRRLIGRRDGEETVTGFGSPLSGLGRCCAHNTRGCARGLAPPRAVTLRPFRTWKARAAPVQSADPPSCKSPLRRGWRVAALQSHDEVSLFIQLTLRGGVGGFMDWWIDGGTRRGRNGGLVPICCMERIATVPWVLLRVVTGV